MGAGSPRRRSRRTSRPTCAIIRDRPRRPGPAGARTSAPPTAAGASPPRSPSPSACSRSGSATSSSTGTATTCPMETLTANLREAFTPGAVVLAHDGGGNRENTVTAVRTVVDERLAAGLDVHAAPGRRGRRRRPGRRRRAVDRLRGRARRLGPARRRRRRTDRGGHRPRQFARRHPGGSRLRPHLQGDGIGVDVTGLLTTGTYLRRSARGPAGGRRAVGRPVWLSMQRTAAAPRPSTPSAQFDDVSRVGVDPRSPRPTAAGHRDARSSTSRPRTRRHHRLVPRRRRRHRRRGPTRASQDLTPLQDTADFPVGVAIDARETTGAPSQCSAPLRPGHAREPHEARGLVRRGPAPSASTPRPPPSWTTRVAERPRRVRARPGVARPDPGVVLHRRRRHPADHDRGGQAGPAGPDAHAHLRRRRGPEHRQRYGEFGSETNPRHRVRRRQRGRLRRPRRVRDGLRRSEWYRVLGEEFIDLAFRYADEAFNDEFAAEGSDRPVTLFINDYNTEQAGKQEPLPRPGRAAAGPRACRSTASGHQFHVSLAMPVASSRRPSSRFADLPVPQVGDRAGRHHRHPGHRGHPRRAGLLLPRRVPGLPRRTPRSCSRSRSGASPTRAAGGRAPAPRCCSTTRLQAKPAYYGAVDGELPARASHGEFVFAGDVAARPRPRPRPLAWCRLPLSRRRRGWPTSSCAGRPTTSPPTSRSRTPTSRRPTRVTFTVGDADVDRSAATAAVTSEAVVAADRHRLDRRRAPAGDRARRGRPGRRSTSGSTDGAETPAGTCRARSARSRSSSRCRTPRSSQAAAAPVGRRRGRRRVGRPRTVVTTGTTQIEGTGGATRRPSGPCGRDQTLYVLAEVADPMLDATGSDPWTQDSVEIFLDAGNVKNGPYRYDDTPDPDQLPRRGVVRHRRRGVPAQPARRARPAWSTAATWSRRRSACSSPPAWGRSTAWTSRSTTPPPGPARPSGRWADPTGLGYQSTARWGVAQLVAAARSSTPSRSPSPSPTRW